jgi:SAM-dependent methyltransferase
LHFERVDGVWRFLLPERQPHYAQFIADYETVRQGEGRVSSDANYYRSLPYHDLSGRISADWRIRAASFDSFLGNILIPLEEETRRSLTVLDLGAGNGWLSNRLAQRGHTLGAVDLTLNNFDGLGCHRFFDSTFTPIQAEFDALPLPNGAADLIIFNASLHYSEEYAKTLSESLRVLAPTGTLLILDSPFYNDARSGAQMVEERKELFTKRYGFRSDALKSQNYLTYAALQDLGAALGIQWQFVTPNYGLLWEMRPFKAKLLGQREPAKFHLVAGHKIG